MDKENKMFPSDDNKSLGSNDNLIANCEIPILVEGENNRTETVYDTKTFEFVFFSRLDRNDHIDFNTECSQVLTKKITVKILTKQVVKI